MQVPFQKVRSLQVSPVPYLIGNFPLTVTLSLRLLMLTGADPLDIARWALTAAQAEWLTQMLSLCLHIAEARWTLPSAHLHFHVVACTHAEPPPAHAGRRRPAGRCQAGCA